MSTVDPVPSDLALRARADRLGTAVAWAYTVLIRPEMARDPTVTAAAGFVLVSLAMHCDLANSRTTPVPPEAVARLVGLSADRVGRLLRLWANLEYVEPVAVDGRTHYRPNLRGITFGRSALSPPSLTEGPR